MRFKVYRLRRAGQRLEWHHVVSGGPCVGELVTHLVASGSREYRALSLRPLDAPAGAPAIPDLYEPALLAVSALALRLRGFERLDEAEGPRVVLQEWHCELA